jgi:hypothetical protein
LFSILLDIHEILHIRASGLRDDYRDAKASRVSSTWSTKPWLLAAMFLSACGLAAAQSARVETGLQLRMTDSFSDARKGQVDSRAQGISTTDAATRTTDSSTDTLAPRFRGLTLALTSGLRFTDNAFNTNRLEQREVIMVMSPSIFLDGHVGRHDVQLGYEADIERYPRFPRENQLNHDFTANADLDISRRLQSRIETGLQFGTDKRGELDTRPDIFDEPDRWREHHASGQITLGRRIAQAQIGLEYGVRGTRYLNNNQSARDFDERDLLVTGRYNLGSRYSIVTDLSGAWIDYLDPLSDLDAREYVALVGVEWEATAKTSGSVKMGYRHRNFHSAQRPSLDGFTWDASINWEPKTYSRVSAYSSRSVSEGSFNGTDQSGLSTTDTTGVMWRHGLTERLTFEARAERAVSSFDGGGEDEFMNYAAGMRYRMNRWIDLFGDWDFRSRSSNVERVDYETSSVFIGLDARWNH